MGSFPHHGRSPHLWQQPDVGHTGGYGPSNRGQRRRLLLILGLRLLAGRAGNAFPAAKAAAAAVGKTRNGTAGSNGSSSQKSAPLKTLAEAKKMITTLVENLDILTYGSNSVTIQEAIAKISKDELKQQEVKKHFGIDFEIINDLFERNIINTNMVRLLEKDSA